MNTIDSSFRVATVPKGVGDAVGMEESQWYVAIVKHNTERSCAEKLDRMNIQNYVPIQTEYRIWENGRKAKVDRVVIPSTVFIKCTEPERREIVKLPFINRFMTNKARISENNLHKPLAIIPDNQIETLKFMVGNSDTPVSFSNHPYRKGDYIRIVRGKLTGLKGEIHAIDDKHSEIIIRIDYLGNARLTIETINVEPITTNDHQTL